MAKATNYPAQPLALRQCRFLLVGNAAQLRGGAFVCLAAQGLVPSPATKCNTLNSWGNRGTYDFTRSKFLLKNKTCAVKSVLG